MGWGVGGEARDPALRDFQRISGKLPRRWSSAAGGRLPARCKPLDPTQPGPWSIPGPSRGRDRERASLGSSRGCNSAGAAAQAPPRLGLQPAPANPRRPAWRPHGRAPSVPGDGPARGWSRASSRLFPTRSPGGRDGTGRRPAAPEGTPHHPSTHPAAAVRPFLLECLGPPLGALAARSMFWCRSRIPPAPLRGTLDAPRCKASSSARAPSDAPQPMVPPPPPTAREGVGLQKRRAAPGGRSAPPPAPPRPAPPEARAPGNRR